jgi:hypothetical protein
MKLNLQSKKIIQNVKKYIYNDIQMFNVLISLYEVLHRLTKYDYITGCNIDGF